MYSTPISQAAPLVNAFLQTLLLFILPLAVAAVLGGILGMWLFFQRHSLLSKRAMPRFAADRPMPYIRSLGFLGLLPMLLLLTRNVPGMMDSTAMLVLLSLGATVHLAFHVYGELHTLDESILEMGLASGLNSRAIICLVLLPQGKSKLIHALCETALFLLALGAVAGCVSGGGLTGFAMHSAADGLTQLWCLLLLASLFLLISWLSYRFVKKSGKM